MQSTSKVAVEEQFANGKLKELNNIEVTRFEKLCLSWFETYVNLLEFCC